MGRRSAQSDAHAAQLRSIPRGACVNQRRYRVQINAGLASKLLDNTPDGSRQFCSVGAEEPFVVQRVLARENAVHTLKSLHGRPGPTLSLANVTATQVVDVTGKHPIVCTTMDGLRLSCHHRDASRLFVLAPEHS